MFICSFLIKNVRWRAVKCTMARVSLARARQSQGSNLECNIKHEPGACLR